MKYNYLDPQNIRHFIDMALSEDIADGDHSSLASIPSEAQNRAKLLIKGEGILAGVALAQHIFEVVDSSLEVTLHKNDGDKVSFGEIGLWVKGSAQSILKAERLVLNCMQRMSGIATFTNEFKSLIAHTEAQLLDTRKTTPNFRLAEKWAVKIGGGTNHRYGLFDMIMLKDNHIAYAGGIKQAIKRTQDYLKTTGKDLQIEVETQNLAELEQVLEVGGVDYIMLDNMSVEDMTQAVKMVNKKTPLEASGGITKETIKKIAETGVDFISVGALTHSAPSMDISLKAV